MSQTRQQQAIFPDLPRDKKIVDEAGFMVPAWALYFDQLTKALQVNYKPEGLVIPQKTDTEIASLGNTNGSVANIIYDSTTNEFKGIVLVTPGTPTVPPVTATKTFTLT